MAEKKTTKKATTAEPKKTTGRRTAASKKVSVDLNPENVGFKAGDVYQALAGSAEPMAVEEIAAAAAISVEETLLGIGWLFKEGKIAAVEGKVALV